MIPYRSLISHLLPVLLFSGAAAQVTVNVTSLPLSTPPDAEIYIAGNFNSWSPGNPSYQLTDNGDGTYSITFSPNPGTLQFKFTRGSWETVEGNVDGGFIPNRTYAYSGSAATINLTIAGWEDGTGGTHTATDNVQVLDEDFYIPQLDRTRRIWIYLPPDYATSSKRYPVIYMHDGQNIFDAFYSFAGEWEIDESMNDLFANGDYGAIVVGIDNGGTERFDEYCPWINPAYGGGDGEDYVSFLVNTLKPHIDSTFRTLPEREYTATAGSSMGGLISLYAVAEYPDVFSKAGVFSPAFWVADSAFIHVASKTFSEQVRVYFVASETESQSMIPDMQEMADLLRERGIEASNLFFLNEPDGAHIEWFWAREYPDAYEWLFDGIVLSREKPVQKKIEFYPNPASTHIYLPDHILNIYILYSPQGEIISTGRVADDHIPVGQLMQGMYWLQVFGENGTAASTLFVKL